MGLEMCPWQLNLSSGQTETKVHAGPAAGPGRLTGILEVSARPKGSRYGDRGLRCHSSWRWAQFEKDSSGIGGFQSGMGVGEKNLEVENLREGVRKRREERVEGY